MSKKSAVRRIAKYLPMNTELAKCLENDDEREIIDVVPAASTTKRLHAIEPTETKSKRSSPVHRNLTSTSPSRKKQSSL